MSSLNCLIITIILMASYVIFTLNYPQYQIETIIHNCQNNFIKFLSLMNHIIFLFGNIYLLLFNNTSFEQLKKNVHIYG